MQMHCSLVPLSLFGPLFYEWTALIRFLSYLASLSVSVPYSKFAHLAIGFRGYSTVFEPLIHCSWSHDSCCGITLIYGKCGYPVKFVPVESHVLPH